MGGNLGDGRRGRLPEEFRDRTKRFAAGVIRLYVNLAKNKAEAQVCGRQLLRSGTSVAANTREASRARSSAEFVAKMGVALQEADESLLRLELLREECGVAASLTLPLETETDEIIAIIATMIKGTR